MALVKDLTEAEAKAELVIARQRINWFETVVNDITRRGERPELGREANKETRFIANLLKRTLAKKTLEQIK
ncbi:hypothetical protein SEA_WEASELS2_238 [Rhodococcus phage Weasels2]|uniref:Uncharacterized protein n=1 Tax=Rhodococcus phage Weasels2 TaxID=1897437 RepID=A0A1I9SAL0_9CAUD|nr:hypothetical protein FDH04_gp178 [Rhodococcus phage Weasels2]AOZ63816.1 hypothetical protein SEA_WEASELS2_238 [Rhodococcus phage Weasels2]